MKYKALPDKATADIAYEIYGKNLNELFKNSALALFDTMCNLRKVKPKIKKTIELKNNNVQDLLFDFMEELIFLKDSKYMLFSKFKVKIKTNNKTKQIHEGCNPYNELEAVCYGEKINQKKHELKVDVKAITYHMFKLEKIKDKYKALIVLDI